MINSFLPFCLQDWVVGDMDLDGDDQLLVSDTVAMGWDGVVDTMVVCIRRI